MKLRPLRMFFVALLFWVVPAAQARGAKADVYFGYSRVGANLYAANTPGMNGWQLAMHVKPFPFVGFEGEVSPYSQSPSGFSQHVTLVMFGPRVTIRAAGVSLFAHGLGGIAHENASVTIYPGTGYNAASYAFGGGADVPLFLGFKLRGTADYLGNSKASSGSYSPSYFRVGVGVAYHF